ncbi:MAG: cache domain-containing protein [Nitrosomonas sp.]|nr:cache domain-containing protein [Nitrosomonas sp.]
MKSQKEIILLTTGLFSFAIFTIVLVIAHQAEQLQHEQHKVVESAYLATKQKELKNYLSLAKLAIAHLHITESSPVDINAQQEARNILRKLKFDGDDGYYFIHDFDCKNILQPPDPNREGQYECDRRDSSGKFHIKELIDIAKKEGEGFVHYDVIKPSTEKITHKLSYVVSIPEWRWVLGTGIYTDDINIPLEHVHKEVSEIIASIMRWIAFIATLSISVVGYLQWRTGRSIGQQIGLQVAREQISDELHDWIKQNLIYINRKLTVVLEQLESTTYSIFLRSTLRNAKNEVDNTLFELGLIIDGKGPFNDSVSDSLKVYVDRFIQNSGIPIEFNTQGSTDNISVNAKIALYLVARAALDNIDRHSAANHINMQLLGDSHYITLTVSDNGAGFDVKDIKPGRGLKNMKERMEKLNGTLEITSSSQGSTIIAKVPREN